MRKTLTILSLRLMEFFKSPGSLVIMFVLPVMFSLIFGSVAVKSEVNKPIVNVVVPKGKESLEIYKLLRKDDHFAWKKESVQQAKKNVSDQNAIAAVVIPNNIEQRINDSEPIFEVILERKGEEYYALSPHLQGTANVIIRSYQAVAELDEEAFPKILAAITSQKGVAIEKQTIQEGAENKVELNLMIVGFAIMFMMFGLSGAASTILDERMGGTWGRLMISPVSRFQISLGYLLAYFFMGWIQFAVLMMSMYLIFDTTWGKLTYMIPFASLVILCVVGFSLMIAGIVKTKQQAAALGAVLIVSTCMLGGVYWPIDITPEIMQKISLFVPQSWAMSGFNEIISGNLHIQTLLKDAAALLGFSLVFFFIGLKGFRFE